MLVAASALLWDNIQIFSYRGMYMSSGRIEYASLDGTHIFKIIGEVRAYGCLSLDHLLNKVEQQTKIVGAVVDLTETTFIDSTVLGILAKLGLKLRQRHQIKPFMFSTNPDITTLANSMGLNQIFDIVTCCNQNPKICTTVLQDEQCDQSELLKIVLDAHRTLMQLNEQNKNMFEPLVNQLQKEQNRDAMMHCQSF